MPGKFVKGTCPSLIKCVSSPKKKKSSGTSKTYFLKFGYSKLSLATLPSQDVGYAAQKSLKFGNSELRSLATMIS